MATVLHEGAKALPLQQLLNSYFEILLNPGKGAVNREVAEPLNCPAERASCLQDLGLPRNLPHTGWVELQTAALALTLPPSQDSQQTWFRRVLGLSLKQRSCLEGWEGVQSHPGRGSRTTWGEDPAQGIWRGGRG